MTTVEDAATGINQGQISTEPAAPEPEAPKPDRSSTREYVVFEQGAREKIWNEVKRVTASDVESALSSLDKDLKQGTKYVAVAERYWKPATPTVETQTTISLSFD